LEHFVGTGIVASRTADGGKITTAVGAGFYVTAYLVTAIIAKKTGFLFQFYADLVSVFAFAESPFGASLTVEPVFASVFLGAGALPPLPLSVT